MKKGFTLIELVFTIVILAITTMAIPRIVAQTTNLNIFAVQQELVFNEKSMMSRIQPAKWDSASAYDTTHGLNPDCKATCNPSDTDEECANKCSIAPAILSIAGADNIDAATGKAIRPGIETDSRNIAAQAPTSRNNFGVGANKVSYGESGEFQDIDDFNGFSHSIKTSDLVTAGRRVTGDFVLNTQTSVSINYVADPIDAGYTYAMDEIKATFGTTANANPTNVKLVTVTSTNTADEGASVALRYYTFNIGVTKLSPSRLVRKY